MLFFLYLIFLCAVNYIPTQGGELPSHIFSKNYKMTSYIHSSNRLIFLLPFFLSYDDDDDDVILPWMQFIEIQALYRLEIWRHNNIQQHRL